MIRLGFLLLAGGFVSSAFAFTIECRPSSYRMSGDDMPTYLCQSSPGASPCTHPLAVQMEHTVDRGSYYEYSDGRGHIIIYKRDYDYSFVLTTPDGHMQEKGICKFVPGSG